MTLAKHMPVFTRARNILQELEVPYVVGGGIAVGCYDHQRPTKDMDFLIPEEYAEEALERLHAADFMVKRSDPRWLYQSWCNDTLVDLVFNINAGRGMIPIGREMIARGTERDICGEKFRILSPEDLVIIKILVQHENRSDWWDAITVMRSRRVSLDWHAVMRYAPTDMPKFLSFLLFVQSRHGPQNLYPDWVLREAWRKVEAQTGALRAAA